MTETPIRNGDAVDIRINTSVSGSSSIGDGPLSPHWRVDLTPSRVLDFEVDREYQSEKKLQNIIGVSLYSAFVVTKMFEDRFLHPQTAMIGKTDDYFKTQTARVEELEEEGYLDGNYPQRRVIEEKKDELCSNMVEVLRKVSIYLRKELEHRRKMGKCYRLLVERERLRQKKEKIKKQLLKIEEDIAMNDEDIQKIAENPPLNAIF